MSKKLKILTESNPSIREKSKIVDLGEIKLTKFQDLIKDMELTMEKNDGVGLAAPQIGVNIRMVLVRSEDEILCMINPEITKKSWAKENGEEGCLSVPKTFGKVVRHKKIKCIFFDSKGSKRKIEAHGLFARIIQHEIDHLDGILFIDTATKIKYEK
jgi:peptide deformylase